MIIQMKQENKKIDIEKLKKSIEQKKEVINRNKIVKK